MNTSAPFSVLLSVYYKNSPIELNQAIRSIYTDQILKPSQIVLVEDGELPKAVQSIVYFWKSNYPNIFTIIKLQKNTGLGHALNIGLNSCKYDLIARMDADDISLPDRFIQQYNFFVHHPDVDVLGGQVEEWDRDLKNKIAEKRLPLSHNELIFFTKYRCPFNHPTVMYRKKAVLQANGYPNSKLEDNYLWVNMLLNGAKFHNLKNVLVRMRADDMIKNRRGLSVLIPELKLQKHLYDCGLNNCTELIVNCLLRIILRTVPHFLRSKIYKSFR